jgi:alkaline phosphatase
MMKLTHATLSLILTLLLSTSLMAGTLKLDTGFYDRPESDDTLPLVKGDRARNVILMIGDGMGLTQASTAQFLAVGPEGKLHMQTMPVIGLNVTSSANRLITDSAAGATAIGSGRKTDNKVVGQLPDGTPTVSVAELAMRKGMAIGLVATSSITHATPASFVTHVKGRWEENTIAVQLAESGVDVMLGGGQKYFAPKDDPVSDRDDDRDLLADMRKAGYTVALGKEQMEAVTKGKLIGLFDEEGLDTHDEEQPSVREMTRKAIELLSQSRDGFFLMVEGSQIDWEGHDNEEEGVVYETLQFDMAVGEALEFAKEDGNTLVLVTADHETGGLTVTQGHPDGSYMRVEFSTGSHTATPVVSYAYGPGALEFGGYFQNTEIAVRLARVLNLKGLLLSENK